MSPAFVDRLYPLVLTGDVAGARALLASLDDTELKEAQKWFGRSTSWLDSIPYEAFGDDGAQHARWNEAKWIHDLCAVRLCGPATAARRVRWGDHWSYRKDDGESALVAALCDKDRDWVATFVDEASRASLGGNARHAGEVLGRVLRAVGRHHGLPCPTGSTFCEFWLAGCPEGTIEDCLINDPWMPDLLDNYLASGHCGGCPDLPRAVESLLARGLIERTALLGHVLSLLTAPQRPGSQQMLAKVLVVLEPRPEEIHGGLDYLLGVMSTSVGAVGRVLLPLGLPLLTDGDELAQLTAVIASRSEKDQKKRLLSALKDLPDRIGTEPVLASLEVLAADEDAAFAGQARALANRLGADHASAGQEADAAAPVLGLWDLDPIRYKPIMRRVERWRVEREVYWPDFLTAGGRPKDIDQRVLVNEVLTALAEGRTDHLDGVMSVVRALLFGGDLVPSRFTNLLPDLFFEGGMREVWPRALAFADTCAERLTQPAALADLLRTLSRFAAEVPHQELPTNLLLLAARKGKSKAQVEARVLGAALLGVPVEEYQARLAASPPSVPERRARGLWTEGVPTGLPQDIPLPPPEWTADQLVSALSTDRFGYDQSHFPLCLYPAGSPLRDRPHAWVAELALAATVRAVRERGAATVRGSLVDIYRQHEPRAIVAALDLWAGGRLDVATYWRVATHSEYQAWQMFPLNRSIWEIGWGRVGDLKGFTKALSRDPKLPLLRPQALEYPVQLTMFLRACECLLLADSSPVVLSTPTWCDGTLELDDLLARLEAAGEAGVGPLDLVQALYRLRPVERSRALQIPIGKWFTAEALTCPDGGSRLDAGELVRRWVDAGGLPPLEYTSDGQFWTLTAQAPVPWSTCAAAPAELDTKGPRLGGALDILRTFPLWPDLTLYYGGSSHPEERFPAGARGPFGGPLHSSLLTLMCERPERKGYSHLDTFVLVARSGRLNHEVVARVMALPRQARGFSHQPARDEFGAFAHTFRSVFESGGMIGSWPSALEVAVAGTKTTGATGLAELLRMLADYAVEVPRPRASETVLDALRTFASEPAKDAAHAQARELVRALEQP